MYCDKHNNPKEHKEMMASTRGGYFCPNVDSYNEAGKAVYCTFKRAEEYQPGNKPTTASTPKRIDPGESAAVNSILRGWAIAGTKLTDAKIKEAVQIVKKSRRFLLEADNTEEPDEVEILG